MNFKSYISGSFVLIFLSLAGLSSASKIEKGFNALLVHNYFQSKKTFDALYKNDANANAAYGLAIIHYRNDNPYHNLDSAAKYATLAFNLYRQKSKPKTFAGIFVVDSLSLLAMMDSVSIKKMPEVKRKNTVDSYNSFLLSNYGGNQKVLREAHYLRDELEFNRLMDLGKSDSTASFIASHPQSDFLMDARLLRDRQLFDEYTVSMLAESYRSFIKKYSKNAMVNTAYEKLFAIYQQSSDTNGLAVFVKEFPNAPQTLDAWKLLYSLSVRSYSDDELTRFLEKYPEFPLKNSILKELELNKLVLIPYQKDDLFGFVNKEGKLTINAEYDEVTDFYEGVAVVNKNDTIFFINKENVNPFNVNYSAAYKFVNGIAPVKRNNNWYFINRQGQSISRSYQEIGELAGSAYIVKLNGLYGALDQFGQPLLEPKFEKLGDFSNGFAYYIENGKYGFMSSKGALHRAAFDWISEFDSTEIATVKINQKYGLINAEGKTILPCSYDKIVKADAGVYIVVQNGTYGFFSSDSCLLSPVAYEYAGEKQADFYSSGGLLKLLKKGEQSIINKNGVAVVSFDAFAEVNFPFSGLMKVAVEVKKEKKYGYVNLSLNPVIPPKYTMAWDFQDSTALVRFKNRFVLINTTGVELYSSDAAIERLSPTYFLVNDTVRQIIDKRGIVVLSEVNTTQALGQGLLIVTLHSGEIKLLYD